MSMYKLGVVVHDSQLSKGAYILWSLTEAIKRIDPLFSPQLVIYHEMVLHCRSSSPIYPMLYTFFFGGKGRRLMRLYEPIRAHKCIIRNCDAILASVTALEWRGISTLVKRGYPTILWDIDSPNIDYENYQSIVSNKNVLLLCYSQGGGENLARIRCRTNFPPTRSRYFHFLSLRKLRRNDRYSLHWTVFER